MKIKKILEKDECVIWADGTTKYFQYQTGDLVSFMNIAAISDNEYSDFSSGKISGYDLATIIFHREPVDMPLARATYRQLGIYEPTVPGTELPEA